MDIKLKDTGFISLLNHNKFKAKNVGFYKDQFGRRGASALIFIDKKPFAIWFLQKDFPKGIYNCAVTVADACIVHPVLAYYEGRDLQELIKFISSLSLEKLDSVIYDFVHPWTELTKRVDMV